MLVVAFLQWWYGPGWHDASDRLLLKLRETYLSFSVPILLRTMFAPWKRITTASGGPLDQRFRALVDNLVSRAVGFMVRLLALISACLLMAGFTIVGGATVLLWPALPLLGPVLVVVGLL